VDGPKRAVVGYFLNSKLHILYLDESGLHAEAKTFVLGGLSVFERETYWFTEDIEAIQRRYFPDITTTVDFHIAKLRAPEGKVEPPFDKLTVQQRRELAAAIYGVIRQRRAVLFGVAIEKIRCKEDPYERAFEDIVSRFDLYLRRKNASLEAQGADEQRGLVVVAESSYRQQLEILGRRFRGGATRWGDVRTLADVPFFVPASNARLLQMADFCANAIYGRYNSGHTRDFDTISPRFDREGNKIHGLSHLFPDADCPCIACLSRQFSRQPNILPSV
jgi:hypothetical protein